jgi:hypothetical protein
MHFRPMGLGPSGQSKKTGPELGITPWRTGVSQMRSATLRTVRVEQADWASLHERYLGYGDQTNPVERRCSFSGAERAEYRELTRCGRAPLWR